MSNGELPKIRYQMHNFAYAQLVDQSGHVAFFFPHDTPDSQLMFMPAFEDKVALLKEQGIEPLRETTASEFADSYPYQSFIPSSNTVKNGYVFDLTNPDQFAIFCDVMEIPNEPAFASNIGLRKQSFLDSLNAVVAHDNAKTRT